jgi:hypothetical protein
LACCCFVVALVGYYLIFFFLSHFWFVVLLRSFILARSFIILLALYVSLCVIVLLVLDGPVRVYLILISYFYWSRILVVSNVFLVSVKFCASSRGYTLDAVERVWFVIVICL